VNLLVLSDAEGQSPCRTTSLDAFTEFMHYITIINLHYGIENLRMRVTTEQQETAN
jgi:hypothetical protein